jgi:hypothetical protein
MVKVRVTLRLTTSRSVSPGFRQGQDKVVISLGSVLRLLLGSDNNQVVFSFWSVPRLILEEEEVSYLFSKLGH